MILEALAEESDATGAESIACMLEKESAIDMAPERRGGFDTDIDSGAVEVIRSRRFDMTCCSTARKGGYLFASLDVCPWPFACPFRTFSDCVPEACEDVGYNHATRST
jgi:hypothetical protein